MQILSQQGGETSYSVIEINLGTPHNQLTPSLIILEHHKVFVLISVRV